PLVALQPSIGLRERLGFDPTRPSLRITAARNQPSALQHLQVLGDGRLTYRERLGELCHRGLAGCEAREDRPPCWISQRGERCVEVIGSFSYITYRFHNLLVIYRPVVLAVKPEKQLPAESMPLPVKRVANEVPRISLAFESFDQTSSSEVDSTAEPALRTHQPHRSDARETDLFR